MPTLFPKEIIENTQHAHLFRYGKKSVIIYTIIVIVVLGIFAALPLIKIDVYSSSRGILKPDKERVSLTSIYTGKVLKNNILANMEVQIGDTLLVLDDYSITNKLEILDFNIAETNEFIHDLHEIFDLSLLFIALVIFILFYLFRTRKNETI